MASAPFALKDDQNVTIAIGVVDAAGNAVAGATFDAGSVTASLADGTELSAVVAADELSVLVTALGPITTPDTLTVAGTIAGVAMTPAELVIDVTADQPAAVSLTPGAPVQNAAAPGAPGAPA